MHAYRNFLIVEVQHHLDSTIVLFVHNPGQNANQKTHNDDYERHVFHCRAFSRAISHISAVIFALTKGIQWLWMIAAPWKPSGLLEAIPLQLRDHPDSSLTRRSAFVSQESDSIIQCAGLLHVIPLAQ
jgi:hypothetical protein